MIRIRALNTEFRLHPLTILAALLACRFGLSAELAAVALALCVHEGLHLLAAWYLGVPILRVDLMPFGGAAQLGNLYALSGVRLAAVALAGPVGNLLLIILCAALGWSGALSMEAAGLLVRTNLLLMLFNLLPALPLDGGRVLYALLQPFAGERLALGAGIWLGRLLAVGLVALATVGLVHTGRMNLTLLLAAVFLLASGASERSAQAERGPASLAAAYRQRSEPHRLALIGLDAECTLLDAAKSLRAGEERLFAVYEAGSLRGFVSQEELLKRIQTEADAASASIGAARATSAP